MVVRLILPGDDVEEDWVNRTNCWLQARNSIYFAVQDVGEKRFFRCSLEFRHNIGNGSTAYHATDEPLPNESRKDGLKRLLGAIIDVLPLNHLHTHSCCIGHPCWLEADGPAKLTRELVAARKASL